MQISNCKPSILYCARISSAIYHLVHGWIVQMFWSHLSDFDRTDDQHVATRETSTAILEFFVIDSRGLFHVQDCRSVIEGFRRRGVHPQPCD